MTCTTGKLTFETQTEAQSHMAVIQAKAKLAPLTYPVRVKRVYPCGICDGWHMTSQERASA